MNNAWPKQLKIISITLTFLFAAASPAPAVDISLEVAQRAKSKVEDAAGSVKKGFQNFGEEIAAVGPELYKVKAEIDQYIEAGQWDNLPKGEKALQMSRALKAVGKLEIAYAENLDEMIRSMESYERAVGEAIVATTIIKGANRDAEYFVQQRLNRIKKTVKRISEDPSIREAKELMKSAECKEKMPANAECRRASQKLQQYRLKISAWTREIKLLSQKKRLADLNQQLAATIHSRLKTEGPMASMLFRQVIDTWGEISANMEMLRNMPIDAITGEAEEDQTRKLIALADNMTKMGDDLVKIVATSVDTVVTNFGQVSGITISGGTQSTETILESTESAEQNLLRLLGE